MEIEPLLHTDKFPYPKQASGSLILELPTGLEPQIFVPNVWYDPVGRQTGKLNLFVQIALYEFLLIRRP